MRNSYYKREAILIRGLCPHLEYIHKSELIDLNVQFRGMCPRALAREGCEDIILGGINTLANILLLYGSLTNFVEDDYSA